MINLDTVKDISPYYKKSEKNDHGYLRLGGYFDKISMPVKYLVFGRYFNEPLNDSIPDSVEYLIFGDDFNQSLGNSIPKSVKYLALGRHFNKPLGNSIPESVTHLIIGVTPNASIFSGVSSDTGRNSVNSVSATSNISIFPGVSAGVTRDPGIISFTELPSFGSSVQMSLSRTGDLSSPLYIGVTLPAVPFKSNQENTIPLSVTHLTLGEYYGKKFEKVIPLSVTHLTLIYKIYHSFTVPPSVTHFLNLSEQKK